MIAFNELLEDTAEVRGRSGFIKFSPKHGILDNNDFHNAELVEEEWESIVTE